MDDDTGRLVTRSEFSTADPDMAEEFLRSGYAENALTIVGSAETFTFGHSATIGPGLAVNRLRVSRDFTAYGENMPDDPLIVFEPLRGRVAYTENAYGDVHTGAGDVVLFPPEGRTRAICEHIDLAMVPLDRSAVAAYAAATTGLDPDGLSFEHIAPLSPALGRHWLATVAHVRDDVLADPWAVTSPILLDQAFRSLAAALLSTFPNTALDRVSGPDAAPVRGAVSPATLREVADYLNSHAGLPVGPGDIAELAGMPVSEIVEGMRRRYGRHPAELLWQARLHGVRRDLLHADPDLGATVAELATRWGFGHPGRFRVAYTREFDEAPEQTLHR